MTWSIENGLIASVNQNGEVVGLTRGTTTVTARSGGVLGLGVVIVDQAEPATLEIVPPTASTTVGGTVVFSVIARDAMGQVLQPAPAVTWTSSAPAVATIHPTLGVATASNGSTQIGARAGAITATPATLTVGAPCNGIQSVTAFNAQIDLQWAHEATADNHRIRAEHSARIIVRLTGGGVVATWSAATEGTGRITDRDTNMTTGQTARIDAQGALLKENRPPVTLDVDLATCRYSFRITPWLNAVFTDFDGTQQNSTTATGTLYTGWMELGNWRGLGGLSEVEGEMFPAHSFVWILGAGNAQLPSYLPSAFGMLLWGSSAGASEPSRGAAVATWAILPQS